MVEEPKDTILDLGRLTGIKRKIGLGLLSLVPTPLMLMAASMAYKAYEERKKRKAEKK